MTRFILGLLFPAIVVIVFTIWILRGAPGGWGP